MLVHRRVPRRAVTPPAPAAVAIGIFDGVHRGHQAILRKAAARARAFRGTPVAVTFHPHPLKVLRPSLAPPLLMSLDQRVKAISECGIRAGRVIAFTRPFSRWTPERFVEDLLVRRLRVREVVVGYNFRFGAGRRGSVRTLKELGTRFGFRVHAVSPVRVGRRRVSSGVLRDLIRRGELRQAGRLMGRPVTVLGRVVRGSGRGRKLGFATANLKVESDLLPPVGVYAVRAKVLNKSTRYKVPGTWFSGMANIGFRPTFSATSSSVLLEVHLFGLSRPLYRKGLEVEFIRRLRGERRFASPEALTRQLAIDARRAKWYTALPIIKRPCR